MELNNPEKPKKKYTKHKTTKKFSIRHFVNNKIKGELCTNENETYRVYPLYIQLYYNGESVKFRSEIENYFKDTDISKFDVSIIEKIKYEEEKINHCFKLLDDDDESKDLNIHQRLNLYFDNYTTDISKIVEIDLFSLIKKIIKIGELKFNLNLSLEENEKLYKEYINQDNSFTQALLYKSLYNVKAISALEFFGKTMPAVASLKDKFTSNIWFFDIYYAHLVSSRMASKSKFKNKLVDYSLYEYEMGIFQEDFISLHMNAEYAQLIIKDMDILFS